MVEDAVEDINVSLGQLGLCEGFLSLTSLWLSEFCPLEMSIPVGLLGFTVGKLVFVGEIAWIEEFRNDLFASSLLGATM